MRSRLFPALLKYWRGRRGLSQLMLSVEAEVSARHLSFLESGRAKPSEGMVLRLASVLGVPLRDQNDLLRAAGFPPCFAEDAELTPEIEAALEQMARQHEPYPLMMLAIDGTVLRQNRGATALFGALLADPAALPRHPDVYTLHFDERLLKPAVVGWDALACSMLSRLHREVLQRGDESLSERLQQLVSRPGVPSGWRQPALSGEAATLQVRYARGELEANFLVTSTTFIGPRQLALEEVRIESCFPLDPVTRRVCAKVVAALERGHP